MMWTATFPNILNGPIINEGDDVMQRKRILCGELSEHQAEILALASQRSPLMREAN